jgi:hypothetical protein
MKTFNTLASLTLLSALAGPMSAQAGKPAPVVPACSFGDLSGVTVTACTGYFQDNLLQGGTGDTVSGTIAAQLALLGVVNAASAIYIEKIGANGGLPSVNFAIPLSGDTVIGLHLGGGSDKFGANIPGGATAFYRFNAGTNLDSFGLAMSSSSGVAVFQTSAVPEPETYALMLAGLVGVGFVARRRSV